MSDLPDVADALAKAAQQINSPRDLASTLDTIVVTAKGSLDSMDHVGVSVVHRGGRIETMAATDQVVWDLDELQYSLGEGPCLQAMTEEPLVRVEHARCEHRWPRFIPRAVDRGLRSQLGIRLYVEDETLGGLNLYSTTQDTIDPEVQHIAELFATHASLALGRARREDNLNAALATRKLIGQAIGIVMERYDLTEERAFHYLIRASQHGNIKLRDVAKEVVERRIALSDAAARSEPSP